MSDLRKVYLLLTAAAPILCLAAPPEGQGPAEPGAELHADAAFADVYVNDSFEAADALSQARVLARQDRWTEAAELLQETSDSTGDQLVRLGEGSYIGIREHINNTIGRWPDAGIRAYRELFEDQLLSGLSDVRQGWTVDMVLLLDRHFNTAAAATLADLIGQRALESGDLALAEYVYRRIVEDHPDRAIHAAHCRSMLEIIAAMRGDPAPSDGVSDPNMGIRWMGKERPLGEVVEEIRQGFSGLQREESGTDWPIFGGRLDRNRPGSGIADDLGLLWRFDDFRRKRSEDADETMEIGVGGERDNSRYLSLHPVVSDRWIVGQFAREIVVLHRSTGALAWRFRADSESEGELTFLEDRPPGWDAATIHNGRVYASIPGDTVPYYSYEAAHSPPELVCLDLRTGAVIWRVEQNAIEEAFAEIVFDSSPIVRHGHLYVVGRRRRSFGFEDCYLFRFNAGSGELEHRTHLGSASTGSFGSRRMGRAIAAMHGDTVYVCTNLGTVAAVSAHTGATQWLRLYRRARVDHGGSSVRSTVNASPWHYNPVLWNDGRIIVFPTDGASIMVLSARDGSLLHDIPSEVLGDAEVLLGVEGRRLYAAGRMVTCYDLEAGSLLWLMALPEGESLFGRGLVTPTHLLVPTRENLCAFARADGRRVDSPWGADHEGGNLLALPDQLLVAGAGRISAYVRKSQIWTALRERMAAAPEDPLPALELAEIALSNNDYDQAVSALGEAVARAEGHGEPLDRNVMRRIFDDAQSFVLRLSAHDRLDRGTLDTLFHYASRFPPDTADHLRYRLAFARLYEKHGKPKRAVGLYQQILRDRMLRDLSGELTERGTGSAGGYARACIADLIRTHGKDIYGEYEIEAENWLRRGRQTEDLELLQRIVETFPNSDSAPRALLTHGQLLVDRGHALEATLLFARAYHRYPTQVDRPEVLRKIADAYEAGGRDDYAYLWLSKGAREFPGARIEHGGRKVSFLDYRARLAHVRSRVEPSRPALAPPLDDSYEVRFEAAVTLLRPQFPDNPLADWSRFFVQQKDGVMAYASRTGAKLWNTPAEVKIEATLLIATAEIAVLKTAYEVFALDAGSGKRRWSHGEYPEALDRAEGDWEDGQVLRLQALHNGRLISVRDDGEFRSIDIESGALQWSQTHRPRPSGRIGLADALLAYTIVQDGRILVCLIDAKTGDWLNAIHTEQQASVEDIFVTLDGQVVLVTSRTISSFDPTTGVTRWRVSVSGHPRRSSLLLDLDALYFSDDGRSVKKISLDNGRLLWESERLMRRGDDDMTVHRNDGALIISAATAVVGVDAVSGLTLWQGTVPERARFVARRLAPEYLVAVHVPGGLMESEAAAYFYNHRNGSGLLARDGGAAELGALEDIRAILALDGALAIQTGQTIRGWAHR